MRVQRWFGAIALLATLALRGSVDADDEVTAVGVDALDALQGVAPAPVRETPAVPDVPLSPSPTPTSSKPHTDTYSATPPTETTHLSPSGLPAPTPAAPGAPQRAVRALLQSALPQPDTSLASSVGSVISRLTNGGPWPPAKTTSAPTPTISLQPATTRPHLATTTQPPSLPKAQPPSSPTAVHPPADVHVVVGPDRPRAPHDTSTTNPPLAPSAPFVTTKSPTVSPTPGHGSADSMPNPKPATLTPARKATLNIVDPNDDGEVDDTVSSETPTTSSTPLSATAAPLAYVRERFDRSRGEDEHRSLPEGDSSLRIIGGLDEHHGSREDSQGTSASTRGARVAQVYRVLQYVLSICAAVSMLLLIGFHALAVDARFHWLDMACGPTTWEFVVYVSYVQHLASLSQLVLVKTPPTLWKVMDRLSWTCLLPYRSNDAAVQIPDVAAVGRRLDTILLSGMVAYADRLGIKETDLLVRTVTGLAMLACVFLLLFFVFAAVAKRRMDFHEEHPSRRGDVLELARTTFWRIIFMRVCTLLVLLWIFALYPLSAVSTYEVTMEVRAEALVPAQLLLAGIAMLVVCLGGLLLVGYVVSSRSRAELTEPVHLAAWGSLYADYVYNKRSFLVAPVLLQIVAGVVVGAGGDADVQLALLLAVLAVYLLALWVVRPFQSGCVAPWFVVAVTLLKITNLTIAIEAFTAQNAWSSAARASAADAIVYLNTLVVVCWLVRHCIVLIQSVRGPHKVEEVIGTSSSGQRNTASFSQPSPKEEPKESDVHAGGFLVLDSQRSGYVVVEYYDSQRSGSGYSFRPSESYRGMTASLHAWKVRHMAAA